MSGERARVSFQVQLPYQQYSRAPVQWQERQEETARVRASSVRRQQTPQCFRSRHFDSRKRRSCQRTPSPSPEAAMLAPTASLSSDGPSQSRHLIPALQSTNGDKLSLAPRERQLLSDLTSPVVAVSSSPLSYHLTTNNRAPGHPSSSCCRTCLASLPNRPGSTCASRPKTSRFGWCARRQKDRSVNFAKPPTCLPRLPQRWGASSSLCQASSSNTATSWKMRPCWTTKGSPLIPDSQAAWVSEEPCPQSCVAVANHQPPSPDHRFDRRQVASPGCLLVNEGKIFHGPLVFERSPARELEPSQSWRAPISLSLAEACLPTANPGAVPVSQICNPQLNQASARMQDC